MSRVARMMRGLKIMSHDIKGIRNINVGENKTESN